MDLIFRHVPIDVAQPLMDVILDLPARLMVLKRGKIVVMSACQRSVVF
ncbi:UNVERIFIED_ORG: hypothetical protein J3D59_001900 [Pseudomonas fluorescens]